MVADPVGYFQDIYSQVVLKFQGKWDVEQMKIHKDYREVTEKEYKEYKDPKKSKEQ